MSSTGTFSVTIAARDAIALHTGAKGVGSGSETVTIVFAETVTTTFAEVRVVNFVKFIGFAWLIQL